MKTSICIWCNKNNQNTTFLKKAHIIPQTLGGKLICENVCDNCNSYFGNWNNKLPPIEETIKETFSISRAMFLYVFNEIGKNKILPRFSSRYFDINFRSRTIKLKPCYTFRWGFQEKLSRQLIRGIYKMYLETIEYHNQNALDSKYNFIREFSRYNLNNLPLFYFQRKHGALLIGKPLIIDPDINIDSNTMAKYLVDHPYFFEFEFIGHVFSIARSKCWNLDFGNYSKQSMAVKDSLFKGFSRVNRFDNVDFSLKILSG